jgi:hypothetical protein
MIEIIPNWHPIFVHFTVALLIIAATIHLLSHQRRAGEPVDDSRALEPVVRRGFYAAHRRGGLVCL